MIKEPMLSGKAGNGTLRDLLPQLRGRLPMLLSMKLDGIRAIVDKNAAGTTSLYTRRLKPVPNVATRTHFGTDQMYGLDGELIVGSPFAQNVFHTTDSGVMTQQHDPKAVFYVFDDFTEPHLPFKARFAKAEKRVKALRAAGYRVGMVPHVLALTVEEVEAFCNKCLLVGYEGIMARDPNGPYKFGRSTLAEGYLLKVKPREDFEAVCIGWKEGMTNTNVAETNELGRTKRASTKAGKVGRGTFGGLLCLHLSNEADTQWLSSKIIKGDIIFDNDGQVVAHKLKARDADKLEELLETGAMFNVGNGPGLTEALRARLWAMKHKLPGRITKCTKLPIGEKDLPRLPQIPGDQFKDMFSMQGFRSEFEAT